MEKREEFRQFLVDARSIVSPSNLSDLVDATNISGGDSSSGGPLESPVSVFLQKINSREEC